LQDIELKIQNGKYIVKNDTWWWRTCSYSQRFSSRI